MAGINTGDEVRTEVLLYYSNYSPLRPETRFRIIRSSFRDLNVR
jgi:hypothetical protein